MRILLFFLFFVSTNAVFAQNRVFTTSKTAKGKAKDHFDKARYLIRAMQYPEAIRAADAAFKADTNFIDAIFLKASIYNELENYKAAEEALESALKMSETIEPDAWFSLAQTEKNQDKYTEAISHYEKFLSLGSKNKTTNTQAKTNLENCKFIDYAIKNPVPFNPQPLSEAINTSKNSEFLPCFTADGETLIFTRRERGDEDLMISQKREGIWTEAKPIVNVNTQYNEGAETISADGKYMVLTACNRTDGFGSCDLYYAEFTQNGWTTPKNIGNTINTKGWESQPSLSADGRKLYFSSIREGGLGGHDIWMSTREKDLWSVPVNLGSKVNTAADDEGPFAHQDNQTLYFMSNGHTGMGDFDLYFVRKDEKGEWGKVENMGYPINSKRSEGSLAISLDGKKAFFASDRKYGNSDKVSAFHTSGKSYNIDSANEAETDLYEFDLYEAARPKFVNYVKGKVYDVTNFQNLRAKVEITDLANNEVVSTVISDWKGEFLLCLPAGKNYAFTVKRAKYAFYSNNFALENGLNITKPFLLDVPLIPLTNSNTTTTTTGNTATEKAKKTVVLKNIFFETASAKLLPTSTAELDRLKEMLDENATLRIQLNGHTDSDGTDASNLTLSSNRAKAVYDYLIQKGIAAIRLQHKGFGESQHIATNDTPEGKQENRRTEFEILGF